MDKHRIQHSFAQAASAYDQHARMQREAAAALALRMQRQWPEAHRILEIGCGTGNLTRHLLATYPQAQLLATDLAPSMVATCQTLLPPADRPRVQFEAADGEQLDATGFDLVASSLVFQWFEDTPATLRRLHAQGARVAVATLVDGYAYGSLSMTAYTLDAHCPDAAASGEGAAPIDTRLPPEDANV